MKKFFPVALLIMSVFAAGAQSKDIKPKTDWSKIDFTNRPNDHFMLQYGIDGWSGTNDSINPSGFSRHFNFYFLFDKPFKSSPHFSFAFGAGLGSSNIFFKNTYIDLKSPSSTLPFKNVIAADHFSKYKLTTLFLELPLEFRYAADPVNPQKGFKVAFGAKIGTLLKAQTKGKNLVDVTGKTIYGPTYISKESDKRFINSTRIAVTGRVGYGNISLDGSYQISSFLKSGSGPTINPYSIGITLSGL